MFTLLVALVAGAIVFGLVAVFLDPLAATVPAILVFGIVGGVMLLRIKTRIDNDMAAIMPMLQRRQIDLAQKHLETVRNRWQRWMPLLSSQVDAQLGMIEFYQLHYDEALPLLEKGRWRNWIAAVCIGVIHFKKKRFDAAWESLDKAIDWGPKESMAYLAYAVLLTRAGKREQALEVLARGLKVLPESKKLAELKTTIANKKKIKTSRFGEQWYQFFPDELVQRQVTQMQGGGAGPGFKALKTTKQMRRGR